MFDINDSTFAAINELASRLIERLTRDSLYSIFIYRHNDECKNADEIVCPYSVREFYHVTSGAFA